MLVINHDTLAPDTRTPFPPPLPSEPLLPMPLLLPPRKPRRLRERMDLPILLRHAVLLLLPRPLFQLGQNHVLHVPRVLIRHDCPLSFLQHLGHQCRHVRFVSKLFYRREQRFEVEDDGTAQRQAAQRLPVDAEMDAGEGKVGDLEGAEVLVRVAGRHEEGFVDFETPGSALDGAVGWEAREVSIEIA